MLDKKEESQPTILPTIMPTGTPTLSPTTQRHSPKHQQPLAELCDKKNADKLEICFEYFTSEALSVVPSDAPSTLPSAEVLSSEYPTITPTAGIHFEADQSGRVLIELGHFDMSITIMTEGINQLRSRDTFDQYPPDGDFATQYEHAAAKQHLHEVYTAYFLNPLTSLNLTFMDLEETNEQATRTRSSIFYGSVEFEKVVGYSDPTQSELDELTSLAFAGDQKNRFLDVFQTYHGTNSAENVYDVIVQKMDHIDINPTSDNIMGDSQDANKMLPSIIGIVVGAMFTCIAGSVFLMYRKKSKSQNSRTHPKSLSPMRQILHSKRVGKFNSNDEEIIDFRGNNLDAYLDSASITSRSQGETYFQSQLKFHVENVDNLRQWGVDVEQISIPTIVERSSSCNCEDVFVDALSELK